VTGVKVISAGARIIGTETDLPGRALRPAAGAVVDRVAADRRLRHTDPLERVVESP